MQLAQDTGSREYKKFISLPNGEYRHKTLRQPLVDEDVDVRRLAVLVDKELLRDSVWTTEV